MYSGSAVIDASPLGIGSFEGHEAIRSVLEDWVQPYEDFQAEFEEFRDFGNDVTFAVLLHRGRPAGSSEFVDVRHTYTHIWTDGLIEWQTVRPDIDEARATAERLAKERG
jgi:hypothetical protein